MSSHTVTRTGRDGRTSKPPVRFGSFNNGITYDAIGNGPRTVIFLPGPTSSSRRPPCWTSTRGLCCPGSPHRCC